MSSDFCNIKSSANANFAGEPQQQPAAKEKRDAFDVLMKAATKRSKLESSREATAIKPATLHDNNALESLMKAAAMPCAFLPKASPAEILAYINRHPTWYAMFAELIRLEKEDCAAKASESCERKPFSYEWEDQQEEWRRAREEKKNPANRIRFAG